MRARTAAATLAAAAGLVFAAPALALSSSETLSLAAEGRYEELRIGLEADAEKKALRTRDLHALCFAYSKTKRYTALFSCLEKLQANIDKGDTRTRLFALEDATPALYLMRGEAQLELGAYAQAAADAAKTLEWLESEGGDETDLELNALSLLAMAAALSGDKETARKHLERLENVSTFTLTGNGYVSTKAMALARAYMALGDYARTLEAIERDKLFTFHAFLDRLASGAALTGRNNWAWQELPRAFMVNRALQGIGKTAEAKAGYDRLLNLPQVRDNGDIYWLILFERGELAAAEGKLDEAIDAWRRAVEVIEQYRASIQTESSKIGFVGDKQRVYQRLIDALYVKGMQSLAFEYIERAKSRALVDMLAARRIGADREVADPQLRQLVDEFDRAEQDMVAQVPVSASEGKAGQRSVKARVLEQLRTDAPELSTLLAVSALPADTLRDMLPAGEAMIQYYYQGTTLYASASGPKGMQMVKLDADGLEADIRQFREAIDQESDAAYSLARKLYDRLIRPLEASLAGQQRLLIIPHGALHYLPFAALADGERFLIDTHALRVLPSASVLPYLRNKREAGSSDLLVLGNPDLGNPKYDLPSAQAEAESIAKRSAHARLLLRAQATETLVKVEAARYPVLHIASHGIFHAEKPLDSALLLARDDANDGKLTVGELYGLRLNADLVTLSACETGLGRISSGDDVVGLTRGFLYAGSRSVVASLWQVDDEATARLMMRFYEGLATLPKNEALRAAQLEIRKRYPHPYYWSAFFLTGAAG